MLVPLRFCIVSYDDSISIWNLSNGKLLSTLDVSSSLSLFICGAAALSKISELDTIVFAFATCKFVVLVLVR